MEDTAACREDRQDLATHLSSCAECADEVNAMREHATLLRTFELRKKLEPAPGFYARVMQRIEERAITSMWAVFIYSPFGKRLALASLALALAMGTWVIGVEKEDGHLGSAPVIVQDRNDLPVTGDQQHQRDVVLVNLAPFSASVN